MCGICGVALSSRSTATVDRSLIERMRDVQTHRGPDDAGFFLDERVGLGHRRLSIVDVSGGHQPWFSDDRGAVLVYNGEVYNHLELRARLERRGHTYRSRCDTETVLRQWQEDGSRAPASMRGMFAYAIWDRHRGELFLARDRFGVKPLYYALTADGSIYFASEIKGILASSAVSASLNARAVPEYLANHATFGEETMYAGIRRVPPGYSLRWRDGAVTLEQYWDLSFGDQPMQAADRELVEEYGRLFHEAVRMRLMADVPLGCFLSGGIDSASITAVMSKLAQAPVKTFSVAFAEREANELAYARVVAKQFRTEHREVVVSPAEFFAALPRMVWHEDEPIAHPSSVPLYFVSRLAADHVKVVLTGEGSDETLAGYGRYPATLLNFRAGASYEQLTNATTRARIRDAFELLPARSRLRQKLSRTFLSLDADLLTLYFDNFAVFSRARQAKLLRPEWTAVAAAAPPYAIMQRQLARSDATTLLDRLLYVDTKTYLHELLMKQDQMSMAASVESRVPFLDHLLVEYAARLPQHLKLRGFTTKRVLRRLMKGVLPPAIIARPKMGFPVPIATWLRGPYRHVLDEFVLGERAITRGMFEPAALRDLVARHIHGGENHGERLWSLINLEIWQRIQLDGEPVESIRLDAPVRRRPQPAPVATVPSTPHHAIQR